MITQHVMHDGEPHGVAALLKQPETRDLGAVIARCIRRNPSDRTTIRQARQLLANLTIGEEDQHWPVRIAS
jgi:hypothetical protein